MLTLKDKENLGAGKNKLQSVIQNDQLACFNIMYIMYKKLKEPD